MSQIYTRMHYVPEGDVLGVERIQDCKPIVRHAANLRNAGMIGDKEMRHAAHFPAVVVERYIDSKGITFEEFIRDKSHIKLMLNDPALTAFRVWEGRI